MCFVIYILFIFFFFLPHMWFVILLYMWVVILLYMWFVLCNLTLHVVCNFTLHVVCNFTLHVLRNFASLFILSQISSIFLDHKIMTELSGKRWVFVQVGIHNTSRKIHLSKLNFAKRKTNNIIM